MGNIVKASTKFIEGMAFETELGGHKIIIDAEEKVGGKNLGASPKPLILSSLSGCTAMDVISILRKMRVEVESFTVDVEANSTDEHPKYYDKIKLIYRFKGKDLPMKKLEKAVSLSQDRYCGVSYMLSKTVDLSHKIIIEE
ncbi:MAG: OsmC family protein [Bacteroidota bacterium]|nr:OsmC family protein [Bacteroidota bacterium]